MICAARDAGMHEVIIQRKDGYRHKLVQGGADLSGGQRQRLEIARVLAQDPTIIIMDEATSALDAKTEHGVVESISKRGITTVIIAHRLSTIRDADEIIVLDRGKVVERGSVVRMTSYLNVWVFTESLPEREQVLVVLHFYKEYSHRQTAQTLGISETNSKILQNKAMKSLKSGLKIEMEV